MSKRIKKFRETWEDDEWGTNEDYSNRKNSKNLDKRNKRKQKFAERWYDDDFNLKRKK